MNFSSTKEQIDMRIGAINVKWKDEKEKPNFHIEKRKETPILGIREKTIHILEKLQKAENRNIIKNIKMILIIKSIKEWEDKFWACLREKKNYRKWETLVGYTANELKNHLEKQFTNNMTWEEFTRGNIHIEHILPKELFEFKDENDILFKLCWRLENLRPEWGRYNESKGDILPDGRFAHNLTKQEKIEYLKHLGLL